MSFYRFFLCPTPHCVTPTQCKFPAPENVLWHPRIGAYLSAPDGHVLFQHAELLEVLFRPFPKVRIVLSTSRVRRFGCAKAAKNLNPFLRAMVIGATFHSRMAEAEFSAEPRGVQVWSDVLKRKPRDWLALDDDYLHCQAWCLDKYVRTDKHEGIGNPAVLAEFKEKLIRMCR